MHTYTEKEHILRSTRSYSAYVYAKGPHLGMDLDPQKDPQKGPGTPRGQKLPKHKKKTKIEHTAREHFFLQIFRGSRREHILRSMRGYLAYVYGKGAHFEVHEGLFCIRVRKRSTFSISLGAQIYNAPWFLSIQSE